LFQFLKAAVPSTTENDIDGQHKLSAAIKHPHELFITLSP
jgi:hypothetical protein